MRNEDNCNFRIMKSNGNGGSYVEVARGPLGAHLAIERLNKNLTQEERDAGWFHFKGKATSEAIFPKLVKKKRPSKPGSGGKRNPR